MVRRALAGGIVVEDEGGDPFLMCAGWGNNLVEDREQQVVNLDVDTGEWGLAGQISESARGRSPMTNSGSCFATKMRWFGKRSNEGSIGT
jgi:hypothetical protein